jgi:hypothetical protein
MYTRLVVVHLGSHNVANSGAAAADLVGRAVEVVQVLGLKNLDECRGRCCDHYFCDFCRLSATNCVFI